MGTPAVDCMLLPMVMVVQESMCIYDRLVDVLNLLHRERRLGDTLGAQRARFEDQHNKLRQLYRVRRRGKLQHNHRASRPARPALCRCPIVCDFFFSPPPLFFATERALYADAAVAD